MGRRFRKSGFYSLWHHHSGRLVIALHVSGSRNDDDEMTRVSEGIEKEVRGVGKRGASRRAGQGSGGKDTGEREVQADRQAHLRSTRTYIAEHKRRFSKQRTHISVSWHGCFSRCFSCCMYPIRTGQGAAVVVGGGAGDQPCTSSSSCLLTSLTDTANRPASRESRQNCCVTVNRVLSPPLFGGGGPTCGGGGVAAVITSGG